MPQTRSLIGTQFVQRGKKFAMITNQQQDGRRWIRHPPNETELSSGTVWFRRCKRLRLIARPRGNGFYKCAAREQNKFRDSYPFENRRRYPITSELGQSVKPGRSIFSR